MVEKTESIVREAPDIEAYKIGLLDSAQALASQGIQLPPQQIAGMTDLQKSALANAGTGIGQYVPYLTGAGQTVGQAGQLMQGSLGPDSVYGRGQQQAFNQLSQGLGPTSNYNAGLRLAANNYSQAGQQLGTGSNFYDPQRQGLAALQNTSAFTGPQAQANQALANSLSADGAYNTGRLAALGQQQQAGQELYGTRGAFDPGTGASAYFDPYQTQVVDSSLADIRREGDIARQTQRAQAVGAGAFGGSRSEIGMQELNRNILEQQAKTAAQLRSAGYQQSVGQAQQGFEQAQQRAQNAAQLRGAFGQNIGNIAQGAGQMGLSGAQQFGNLAQAGGQYGLNRAQSLGQMGQLAGQYGLDRAQTMGSLGQGIGQLAQGAGQMGIAGSQAYSQLGGQGAQFGIAGAEALGTLGLRQGALGELAQNLGQREGQYSFDMGKAGQAQQQAELEALRQSQMAQKYEPYQRVGFLSDIYKGAPSSQMAVTGASGNQPSAAQQILGLGVAGLSAYGGAQRAGMFGFS